MGRLWQTLILSEWKPIFAHVPIENMVYAHQTEVTPEVTPEVKRLLDLFYSDETLSRKELQERIGLADEKNFRQKYLLPALVAGYIEMTIPEKPQSSLQRYRRVR